MRGVGSIVGGLLPSGTSALGSTLWGGASGALSGGISGGIINGFMGGSFKDGFTNGAIGGGIMGAMGGYSSYSAKMRVMNSGCKKLGINPKDPIQTKTDAFLKESQEAWYPDAPMDEVTQFTTENTSGKFNGADKLAKTTANIDLATNTLNGTSNVYFNPESAFSSAKNLFFTMGHEFVHVSQISQLVGLDLDVWHNSSFQNMIEYHAYSYQHFMGGTTPGMNSFSQEMLRGLSSKFPNYFNEMSWTNFGWVKSVNSL